MTETGDPVPAVAALPPQAPTRPGFRSGRRRSRWAIAAFIATIASALWAIGGYFSRIRVIDRALGGEPVSLGALNGSDTYLRIAVIVNAAIFLFAVIAFVMWVHRAYANAYHLTTLRMRFTPGWAVGWFFVPIANLYRPFQIASNLWLATDPYWTLETGGQGSPPERSLRVPIWWGLWLLAGFSAVPGAFLGTPSSVSDLRTRAFLGIASAGVLIASCAATTLLVRRIESRQEQQAVSVPALDADATPAAAPIPTATAAQRAPRHGPAWVAALSASIGLLIAAPLAVGVLVTNGTRPVTGAPTTPGGRPSTWLTSNANHTTCSDGLFNPAVPLSAGLGSTCAKVQLGTLVLGAHCTGPTLPPGVGADTIGADGKPSTLGSVSPTPQGCRLSVQSPGVTTAIIGGDASGATGEPGDIIVVADVAASTNPETVSGLALRATSTGEFDVAVRGGGGYQVDEVSSQGSVTLLEGDLADNPAVPGLDLGGTIRLIVVLKDTEAAVYIDGRLVGDGQITVPDDPGFVAFEVRTLVATTPALVTLRDLYIFASS